MFSPKEISQVARRKRRILANGDRLRSQCGNLWGAVGHRAAVAEERSLGRLNWVRPVVSIAAVIGLAVIQQKSISGKGGKFAGPIASAATLAMDLWRRRPVGELQARAQQVDDTE